MQPVRPWFSRRSAERPASPASGRARAIAALGLAAASSGCFVGDTALGPPLNQLYYPTGLVVSPGHGTLYVTNSDFDLQYNGGTVLALDLKEMRHNLGLMLAEVTKIGDPVQVGDKTEIVSIRDACGAAFGSMEIGFQPDACGVEVVADCNVNPTAILNPGPCAPIPLSPPAVKVPFATIGAFASGAVLTRKIDPKTSASNGARLYVPVRGDPSITFFDIADDGVTPPADAGKFDCGGIGDVKRCDKLHAIGTERFDNSRGVSLPVEPVGIAVSEDGTAIVTAHQTEKAVSLTVNDAKGQPTLQFVLGNMPDGPTEVATVPIAAEVKSLMKDKAFDYQPGFLVSYRASAEVDLFRFHADDSLTPRPFLTRSGTTSITVNASGKDSRGIAVDASARQACEAGCAGDDACLVKCLDTPLRVFIANRAPPSLLTGRVETKLTQAVVNGQVKTTGAYDQVFITDSTPLAFGASKITLGTVLGKGDVPSLRVFASAFDSRLVFSYDPEARRVDNVIKTGRGPHAIAVDTGFDEHGAPYSFLYIGHFTDSYLGVVDLDMNHPRTFGTMFASVGTPAPPRESK